MRYHRVACLKLRDIPVVSRCSFPEAQIAVGNAVTQQTVGLTALPPNVLISPCFLWTRRQTARVNLLTPREASQRNRPVPSKKEKNMHRLSPEICIKERQNVLSTYSQYFSSLKPSKFLAVPLKSGTCLNLSRASAVSSRLSCVTKGVVCHSQVLSIPYIRGESE